MHYVWGVWTPARVAGAFPGEPSTCELCGQAGADEEHIFWRCPKLAEMEDPLVLHTQYLRDQVSVDQECLWLRGLLPSACLDGGPIALETPAWWVGAVPSEWPSGWYFTDGSGGAWGSVPALRRCGWGVARLRGDSFQWGAYGALPGLAQSVPRSELFAVLVILRRAVAGAFLHIVSDSWVTVACFLEGPGGAWRASANADLWAHVWRLVSTMGGVQLHWVKSHCAEQLSLFEWYAPKVFWVVGNACADVLADYGAKAGVVPAVVANAFVEQQALVERVQRRLVAVLEMHLTVRTKSDRGCVAMRLPPLAGRLVSPHRLVAPGTPFCLDCGWGPRGARQCQWFKSTCPGVARVAGLKVGVVRCGMVAGAIEVCGVPVHASHLLLYHLGFFVCVLCGFGAGSRLVGLKGPCPRFCSPPRRSGLNRVLRGQLPYHLREWPCRPTPPPLWLELGDGE